MFIKSFLLLFNVIIFLENNLDDIFVRLEIFERYFILLLLYILLF